MYEIKIIERHYNLKTSNCPNNYPKLIARTATRIYIIIKKKKGIGNADSLTREGHAITSEHIAAGNPKFSTQSQK